MQYRIFSKSPKYGKSIRQDHGPTAKKLIEQQLYSNQPAFNPRNLWIGPIQLHQKLLGGTSKYALRDSQDAFVKNLSIVQIEQNLAFQQQGNEAKTKKKGTYSTPYILEKQVGGHMTTRFEGEASKGRCHIVGGGVGACSWGPMGGEKKRTCLGVVGL